MATARLRLTSPMNGVQHVEPHRDQGEAAGNFKPAPVAGEALEVLKPTHGERSEGNRNRAAKSKRNQQNHSEQDRADSPP